MSLLETLGRQLTTDRLQTIAGQLGATESQTETAVNAALPALLSGLGKTAGQGGGQANALLGVIDQDGDGQVFDDLGGLLSGASQASGGGGAGGLLGAALSSLGGGNAGSLLGTILGGRQDAVQQGVAKASGLNGSQVQQLLLALVPMVLSALGQEKKARGLDADGVAQEIAQEQTKLETQAGLGGALTGILDKDDDGSIADDLASLAGKNLLGGFLGR